MSKTQITETKLVASRAELAQLSRRKFLGFAGAASGLIVVASSCKKETTQSNSTEDEVDLGSGDPGILNYAYALEQLEAAFYTQVIAAAAFNTTFSSALERSILTDIRDHEVAHREFFKAAITAAAPNEIIPGLTPDFSSVNFN